jgi:hypothetical protein
MYSFYSGFCLKNEEELFSSFLEKSDFTFAGFSYGCIKLVEDLLEYNYRVDKIQLFCPAFFNDRDEKFKKSQLKIFQKNRDIYIKNFLKNCASPSNISLDKYFSLDYTVSDLEKLLYYHWCDDKLKKLQNRGIEIEIYLGNEDKIISSNIVLEFFKEFGNVYVIKDVGHILLKTC